MPHWDGQSGKHGRGGWRLIAHEPDSRGPTEHSAPLPSTKKIRYCGWPSLLGPQGDFLVNSLFAGFSFLLSRGGLLFGMRVFWFRVPGVDFYPSGDWITCLDLYQRESLNRGARFNLPVSADPVAPFPSGAPEFGDGCKGADEAAEDARGEAPSLSAPALPPVTAQVTNESHHSGK